jgi:predicted glycoside hydrolase/deacetylase ChbG (UPF0249 family)
VEGFVKIIVNADDFGWDDETVDATIACFEAGALTSATIMATMPAAERAAEYAKRNPRFSFGVHLTYVGDGIEPALTPGPELPTLARADGIFLPSQKTRLRALFRQVDAKQVERETIAQLDKIKSLGVPISHVDSHGHMHKFHAFRTTLAKVRHHQGPQRAGCLLAKTLQESDVLARRALEARGGFALPHDAALVLAVGIDGGVVGGPLPRSQARRHRGGGRASGGE